MLQPQASPVSSGCSSLGRMGCSEATGKGGIGPSASNTAARAEAFLSVPAEIKDIFVSVTQDHSHCQRSHYLEISVPPHMRCLLLHIPQIKPTAQSLCGGSRPTHRV